MKMLIAFLIACATVFGQCSSLTMNPVTGLLDCIGSSGGGSGTVTSVGLAGTANQITVTGASPITTSGSWTLSFTNGVTGSAASAIVLQGQPTIIAPIIPQTTIAGLAALTQSSGQLATVSDGLTSSDCVAGSGVGIPLCFYTGSTWIAMAPTVSPTFTGTVSIGTSVSVDGTTGIATTSKIGNAAISLLTGAGKWSSGVPVGQAACADLSNGAASCSTDTTSASNISSGTLAIARGGTGASTLAGANIQLYTDPLMETYTVGTGGVTANHLVKLDTDGTVIAVTGTEGILGIAQSTVAATGTVKVAMLGPANCVLEGTVTAGRYLIAGTIDPTACKDSGQTALTSISLSTRPIGKAAASGTDGQTKAITLIGPFRFGSQVALTTDVTGVLPAANGGTGVANSNTITLSGNLVTTGAFNPTFSIPSSSTWTMTSGGGVVPVNGGAADFAPTAAQTVTVAGVGATVGTAGYSLINNTAATVGAQKYSPCLILTGNGWKTNATAGSEQVDWCLQNVPVQGAADPTTTLTFNSRVNAGAWASRLTLTSGGTLSTDGSVLGQASSGGSASAVAVGVAAARGLFSTAVSLLQLSANGNEAVSFSTSTYAGFNGANVLGWCSGACGSSTPDTAFSRNAAGVVEVNSGTKGTISGSIKAAAYMVAGTKFTTDTGCGTVTSTTGGATAGKFTLNANGSCAVVVTMGNSATASNGWACALSNRTTTTVQPQMTADSTTTATFTFPTGSLSGDVIDFACIGY